jgi:predicted dehydrogenase
MGTNYQSPIRVGLAGLGRAGWGMHCPELEKYPELFKLTAVCDPLRERRELAVNKYGCRAYRRYQDLLDDTEVELVDIATPSDQHVDAALAALHTGRWVLVEKPMCRTFDDAMVLRAASIKARHRLLVRHNRRFEEGFLHVREIVESGLLGEVYDIKLRRGGFSRRDDWQTVKRRGGGQLLNWGPHLVDHGLLLLDAPPKRVWSDLKRVAAVGDAEDYVHLLLTSAAGRTVDIEISGGRIVSEPPYTVTGTRGALTCDDREIRLRYLDPKQRLPRRRSSVRTPPLGSFGTPETLKWIEETIPVQPAMPGGMTRIWEHLYATIRQNRPFPIHLDHAVEVMRILTEARKGTPFA